MAQGMTEMILDILESIVKKITGENKKTIKLLAPKETYSSIFDKCVEGEKDVVNALYDYMETMFEKGPKKGSNEYRVMYEEVDRQGEILYYVHGWSNDKIKELLIIITCEWMTKRCGHQKNFEKSMADYLIGIRYSYP